MAGKVPQRRIPDDIIGNELETPILKNGKKLDGTPKPKGAIRVLAEGKIKSNRPKNVYKELVTDSDTGEMKWVLWWMTEQSEYHGKEEIVRYNPRTQEERSQGFDYTIPFTDKKAKELIAESFGGTSFYIKDGEDTYHVNQQGLESVWLKEVIPAKKAPLVK